MGVLRIHFTAADLARTHVAPTPDVFWEIVLSVHALQGEHGRQAFSAWRQILPSGSAGAEFGRLVRQRLFPLCPSGPYFPDFLTPAEGSLNFDAGLEVVLGTGSSRLRRELGVLGAGGSEWRRWLSTGEALAVRSLESALRTYYRRAIAPHWEQMVQTVRAESALRTRLSADSGVAGMLSSLGAVARWEPPMLLVRSPITRDVYLEGRGLMLIPSYFARRNAICLLDPQLPQVLVYPAARLEILTEGPRCAAGLEQALGRTRTWLLHAARSGRTTTQLAEEIGVSVASVSEQAQILRGAGLIRSERDGRAVVHIATPLGEAVMDQ